MNKDEYLRQYEIGETYWWFTARRSIIVDVLSRTVSRGKHCNILDVGCGPGNMLGYLADFGMVHGLDMSEEALELCKKRGYGAVKKGEIERTGYPDEVFDTIIALDVLEHCVDDTLALKEVFRVCKKSGYCIFTVPAYRFLWTQHDTALHHKRRYAREELISKVQASGFSVINATYFNALLFPSQFYFRIIKKSLEFLTSNSNKSSHTDFVYPVSPFLNKILRLIFGIEKYILRILSLPFGLSLLCVACKSDEAKSVLSHKR